MPTVGAEGPDGGRRPAVASTTGGTTTAGAGGADVTDVAEVAGCGPGAGCRNVLAVATDASSCATPLRLFGSAHAESFSTLGTIAAAWCLV